MRPPKITLAIWAIVLLPVSIYSQFGLESNAHSEATYYFEKATQHHDASEFSQAVSAYQKAVNFAPEMTDAWYNLALIHIHMGNFGKAERSLDTLFSLSPMDVAAHTLHGLALYQQGQCERAVAAYNFALSEKPTKNLYLARGLAHYCTGKLHLASLDFDQVLAADPGNIRACQAKASILLEKENYHLAIRFCNRILDRISNDAAALTTRAVCRFRQGAKYRAMADFDMAMTSGQMAETYLARGHCRLSEKEYNGALADAKLAMRIDPFDPEVYSFLAAIELGQGFFSEAKESVEMAIDLAPNCEHYHYQLAEAALDIQAYDLAIQEVYIALDLGAESEEAKRFLRHIYQRMDIGRMVGVDKKMD